MCGVDNLTGEQIILTLIEHIGKTGVLMDVAYAYNEAMARKYCSLAYLTPNIARSGQKLDLRRLKRSASE